MSTNNANKKMQFQPLYDKPAGAEKYDLGALNEYQQNQLNQTKVLFLFIKKTLK